MKKTLSQIKISVVIPAYNEETTISQCLSRVFTECDALSCEVIVVNNASTDQTAKIALFDGASVVFEDRKGITFARQKGLEASCGELIANVDADTLMPSGWMGYAIRAFDREPNLVALTGPCVFYDVPKWVRFIARSFNWIAFITSRMSPMIQGGNFVVRRTAMKKICGFDTSIDFYGEDTDVAVRLAKVGKVRWDRNFRMISSGRRLMVQGVLSTGISYTLNYLSTLFLGHPVSKTHRDIRGG